MLAIDHPFRDQTSRIPAGRWHGPSPGAAAGSAAAALRERYRSTAAAAAVSATQMAYQSCRQPRPLFLSDNLARSPSPDWDRELLDSDCGDGANRGVAAEARAEARRLGEVMEWERAFLLARVAELDVLAATQRRAADGRHAAESALLLAAGWREEPATVTLFTQVPAQSPVAKAAPVVHAARARAEQQLGERSEGPHDGDEICSHIDVGPSASAETSEAANAIVAAARFIVVATAADSSAADAEINISAAADESANIAESAFADDGGWAVSPIVAVSAGAADFAAVAEPAAAVAAGEPANTTNAVDATRSSACSDAADAAAIISIVAARPTSHAASAEAIAAMTAADFTNAAAAGSKQSDSDDRSILALAVEQGAGAFMDTSSNWNPSKVLQSPPPGCYSLNLFVCACHGVRLKISVSPFQ
jgi:hypothetical protein